MMAKRFLGLQVALAIAALSYMYALTAPGKDAALEGAIAKMKFVNLFSSVTKSPTSGTAIAASLINMTGAKAAGWTNGKMVYLETLGGAVTNLTAKRTYFIVGEVAEGFEIAEEEGGAGIKMAGAELTVGTKFNLLTELSGGGTKREATAWNAVTKGEVTESATPKIKVPAGKTVTHAGWFEKEAEGTGKCFAVEKLTEPETYGGAGEYTLSSDKLEANTAA
jgi:hypothetical protein